jgi:hypothetical protein
MPVETLTKNLVKDSICPSGKHKIDIHDSGCKGLMLEVERPVGRLTTSDIETTEVRSGRCV